MRKLIVIETSAGKLDTVAGQSVKLDVQVFKLRKTTRNRVS
jgi:hypothetical protein